MYARQQVGHGKITRTRTENRPLLDLDHDLQALVAERMPPGHITGHIKGELLDLRACFNCQKQQRFSLGALRKDPSRKPGARYKNYRRSKFGCRTCGVPLCRNSGCWLEYHRSDYCGQNDNIDPINWLTVWVLHICSIMHANNKSSEDYSLYFVLCKLDTVKSKFSCILNFFPHVPKSHAERCRIEKNIKAGVGGALGPLFLVDSICKLVFYLLL